MSNSTMIGLIVTVGVVGLLNLAITMWESSRHYGAEAKLEAKLWGEHRDHWDQSTRLWNALDKKEDKHE